MSVRPFGGATRTYATCNIVIEVRKTGAVIYAQDYSHETNASYIIGGMHPEVEQRLDVKHMRIFQDMKAFTEWLFEVSAIVNECWFV